MVMDAIYWFGVQGYEGRMADVWETLCSTAKCIVEVGANVGLFTVLGGLTTRGSYVAVEPVPEIASLLGRNIARNNLAGKIEVRQAAAIAASIESSVEINVPNEGRGAPVGAHLMEQSEVSGRSRLRVINVPGLPFKNLIEQADLIKIDAEGIEAELLQSAMDQIVRNRPTLVVEVLPESNRLAALLRELASTCEYTINVIPAYGSDEIVVVTPNRFHAGTPRKCNSKDVVLSMGPLSPRQ
jgi:FkbM family methyltransferase